MSLWITDVERGSIRCLFKPICPICINKPENPEKAHLAVWLTKFIEFPLGKDTGYAIDVFMRCPKCYSLNFFGVPQKESDWRKLKEKYEGVEES